MCHLPCVPYSRPILTPGNPRQPQAADLNPTLDAEDYLPGCSADHLGTEMGEDFVLSKLELI